MRMLKQLIQETMMEKEMNKVDIYIKEVRYDENKVISHVRAEFTSTGSTFKLPRELIVELLKTEKLSIKTCIYKNHRWVDGDNVTLYKNDFITTDGNGRRTDNLENLPKF